MTTDSKAAATPAAGRATRWLVVALRIIVGAVFIFSGIVKAIDPWGMVYKLQEYLMVLNWSRLLPLATFGAFALPVMEFTLGIFALTGCYRRATPILLTLTMAVMLPLTLYIAITDNVTDCGCFGDAIVLSNWATFWKNVALTAAIVFLLLKNRAVKPTYAPAVQWIVGLLSFAFAMAVALVGYLQQPMLDFRPFKVGTQIVSEQSGGTDTQYDWIYAKDGEQRHFTIDSLPDEADGWEFVDRVPIVPVDRVTGQLAILDNIGDDITGEVLTADADQVLLLFPSMSDKSAASTFLFNEIYDYAIGHDIQVTALTSAAEPAIDQWRDLSMAEYDIYQIDDSVLKQIARGDPAIVYLSRGTIAWKRTARSLNPAVIAAPDADIARLGSSIATPARFGQLTGLYAAAMLLLLLFRTYRARRKAAPAPTLNP